ncbi:unnamed protein product [Rotaria sordida]|uniref:RING-CH-type domain-containing protein n=1 Tax=Rotaria sordida TaxID=392033 RepID=A0A818PFV7_9BILA|nr:unnamed protein product [Rotaria sordida]
MSLESQDDLTAANNQLKQCRICLDNDNPNDIISPCLCSGGSAYVHRKCLNDWRSEDARGKSRRKELEKYKKLSNVSANTMAANTNDGIAEN